MFNNKHKTRQLFAILISLALIISQFGIMPLSAYGQDDDYDSANTVYESESEAAGSEDSVFAEEDENASSAETEGDSITEAEEEKDVSVEPEEAVSGEPEENVSTEPEKNVSGEPEPDLRLRLTRWRPAAVISWPAWRTISSRLRSHTSVQSAW